MDERRLGMTNGRWSGWVAAGGTWLVLWAVAAVLFATSSSGRLGVVQATAVVGLAAVVAHDVVAVWKAAGLGPARLVLMALVIVALGWPGHLVLARLGMVQSLAQDLVNLTVVSGVALAVRLAWDGVIARRALAEEVVLRQTAEAHLEAARAAAERPGGPVPVKVGHGLAQLDPRRVAVLEAQGNFAVLSGADAPVFVSESLKALSDRFAPYGFVRIQKSYVVNTALIRTRRGDGVEMSDGRTVPVGRAYRQDLARALGT